MLHEHQNQVDEQDSPAEAARCSRYGLWLFALYLLLYIGFMGLTAFAPEVIAQTPFAGVNIAVLYGLVLIGMALLLALIYAWLCRPRRV